MPNPPLPLRSAADAAILSAHLWAAALPQPPLPADTDTETAMRHYGPETEAYRVWCAWRDVARFGVAWNDWVAEVMPAAGCRPATMGE